MTYREQREFEAVCLQRDALSRDWNRMRDNERDWRIFTRRTFLAAGVVMCLAALAVVMGL